MKEALRRAKKLIPEVLPHDIVKGVHRAAHFALSAAGYRFELRRSGEMKLGLWRKELRPVSRRTRKDTLKRFVLVPGFGDTPLSWLPVVAFLQPLLRQKYDEIVLLDFPGFSGLLSHEKSFPTMDLLIEKVFDTFDSLRPHTIFGHSLGGWLTSSYAGLCGSGQRPQGPRGAPEGAPENLDEGAKKKYSGPAMLILADPSGAFLNDELKESWKKLFSQMMEEGFQHLRPHVFAKEPFWFRFFVSEFASFAENEDIIEFMRSVRDDHFVEELLPHVKARVWLLWGERDTLCPSACAQGWLAKLPKETLAQTVMLKGIGHSPQLENPVLTAAVLGQMFGEKSQKWLEHRLTKRWWDLLSA